MENERDKTSPRMSATTHEREDHLPGDAVIVVVTFINFFLTSSKMGTYEGHGGVTNHHPDAHAALVACEEGRKR